eukprot:2312831-Pyramimonas_sp.AAC.1
MGWSWAMRLCQAVVRQSLRDVGVQDHQVIEDGQVPPMLSSPTAVAAAAYVDNFFVFSASEDVANQVNRAIISDLQGKGLVVHEVSEASRDMGFVGLQMTEGHAVSLKTKNIWRLRL